MTVTSKFQAYSVLLSAWLIANALPHVVVALAYRKIYYQLSPPAMLATEASLDLLNFFIPVLAVRFCFKEPVFESTGWNWSGLKVLGWGAMGFISWFGVILLLNWLTGNQTIQYVPVGSRSFSRHELQAMALMLLFLPAAGEEMMFRGMLQSYITRLDGRWVGICVAAVLFAVRHHPSDIYFGLLNHASLAAWINRFVGLYLGGFIFCFIRERARSTWASWIAHMMMIGLILVVSQLWKSFLPE